MKQPVQKFRKVALFVFFNLLIVLIAFALMEGLASLVLLFQAMGKTPPVAERSHTQYDEELGWVNRPNLYIEDMYGPGLYLKTNSQGFRNDKDFERAVPAGKLRVICSGDSFTLGYGVDNGHTWCQLLAALDERLETVNMGQGGYGIGQTYLWYKRDGLPLAHDVHLFSFITTDFERMRQTEFLGYGKPRLSVKDGELMVENTPVPRRAFYAPWLTQNSEAIRELRSIRLLSGLFQRQAQAETLEDPGLMMSKTVVAAIFKDLERINEAERRLLMLVYLPTLGDYSPPYPAETELWRQYFHLAAQEADIIFIDLIEPFRALPPAQAQALFIPEGALDFPGAAGHYSVQGNEYVAQRLYERLLSLPEVASKLAENKQ